MKIFFSLLLLFKMSFLFAQVNQRNPGEIPGSSGWIPADFSVLNSNYDRSIEGSPFFSQDFKTATVKLKNGTTFFNVSIKVNLYNNEVLFKQGGKELALQQVDSLIYLEKDEDSSSAKIFKTGYPIIDKKDGNSIYQVIVSGKIQLLKYTACNVAEVKGMGIPTMKKFAFSNDYYIYYNGQITKVKASKKSFKTALPDYSKSIEEKWSNESVGDETKMIYLIEDLNS